ncbi:MAG: hypothetical protein EAZ57_08205 [Cytophagales bacterium]|nr:MAG: hypothetical protein EAZ67_09280 [Cytophagales bacterium]TAF60315.1 MAG: hypothetical protein EAZ57_08205 [Cytophagales bacterium]
MKVLWSIFFLSITVLGFSQDVELVNKELNKFQNVRDFCAALPQDEIYFTFQSPDQNISQILCVKKGKWASPEIVSFCDEYSYLEPFLSVDGNRLYFASNRPKNDADKAKSDFDIWYVQRSNLKSDWSKPINLGSPINTADDEFYPTLAANNNLYFTKDAKSGLGKDDIYLAEWKDNTYQAPTLLSANINSEGYEFNAFVSPDESLLIYTKYDAKDGFGSGDLYYSLKDNSGQWTAAKNLGNVINTRYMEYCPFYDAASKTLYFTSKRNNLKPQRFKDFNDLKEYISSGQNGLSRLYKYKIDLK